MHRCIAAFRPTRRLFACGGFPAGSPFCRRGLVRRRLLFRRAVRHGGIDLDRRVIRCRQRIDLDRTIFAIGLVGAVGAFRAVGLLRLVNSGFGTICAIGCAIAIRSRRIIRAVRVIAITAIATPALAALPIIWTLRLVRPLSVALTLCVIRRAIRRLPLVPLFLIDGIDAEVMFGMLKIIFRSNTITCRRCVARQSQVFFVYLESVAANPDAWSVAVE